jgi:predicted ATPase
VAATLYWAEMAMHQSIAHSYRLGQAMGTVLAGWAMAKQGEYAAGLNLLQHGIAQWQGEGIRNMQTYLSALWIEACCIAGQVEEGIAGAVEAHDFLVEFDEHFYEPEIYRLHGDLLLLQGYARDAEMQYRQALALANKQGARSLELRAAVCLARLWQQEGKQAEAHALLAPLYTWFREGFDTPDLQAAHDLLADLAL